MLKDVHDPLRRLVEDFTGMMELGVCECLSVVEGEHVPGVPHHRGSLLWNPCVGLGLCLERGVQMDCFD